LELTVSAISAFQTIISPLQHLCMSWIRDWIYHVYWRGGGTRDNRICHWKPIIDYTNIKSRCSIKEYGIPGWPFQFLARRSSLPFGSLKVVNEIFHNLKQKMPSSVCMWLFLSGIWKYGLGDKHTNSWFSPGRYKSSDSEQIFQVFISTEVQCRYICWQNILCTTVLYSKRGEICSGYKSQTETELVNEEEMVWKIIPGG